jgi:hypothetical protein
MALLHSLQPMLQHCNVVMDLFILQHWAAQPDKAELIASFLRFFGSNCCFAIHHQATYYPARGGELPASLQLPLWALFNDLMLTGCRQLELLAQLLSSAQLGLDAAKWLLHESTATRPRRLKLYSNDETYWEHQQREAARGVTPMVKQLKEVSSHFSFSNMTKDLSLFDFRNSCNPSKSAASSSTSPPAAE